MEEEEDKLGEEEKNKLQNKHKDKKKGEKVIIGVDINDEEDDEEEEGGSDVERDRIPFVLLAVRRSSSNHTPSASPTSPFPSSDSSSSSLLLLTSHSPLHSCMPSSPRFITFPTTPFPVHTGLNSGIKNSRSYHVMNLENIHENENERRHVNDNGIKDKSESRVGLISSSGDSKCASNNFFAKNSTVIYSS